MARITRWLTALTTKRIVAIAAITVVAVWGGTTVVAFAYDRAQSDHLLPGTTIAGVDVGGMSRDAAIKALRVTVKKRLTKPIVIHAGKRTFHIKPKKLGVTPNVQGAVEHALETSDSMTWMTRSYHRLFGWSVSESVPLTNWLPKKRFEKFLDHLVSKIDRPALNAAIVMSKDGMHLVKQHATKGVEVKKQVVRRRVAAALRTLYPGIRLPVRITKPRVSNKELGKTLAVDLSHNELHLFDGFHMAKTYPVATAMPGYSTPPGRWQVIDKTEYPTWVNPCPDGGCWAASEPPTIPPGPSNPLGLRALYLSAPGIRIHGTPDSSSVGTYASHGCIRMYESNVIALYPLVPVNTPALIYGSPPWGTGGSGTVGT